MGKATVILAAVVSIFLTPFAVSAKHITLMWDDEINTKHDGYRIFYGQESHANVRMPGEPPAPYDQYIDVQNPEARSHNQKQETRLFRRVYEQNSCSLLPSRAYVY